MRRLLPLFMILSAGAFAVSQGCTKASADKIAPPCDTTNVSYSSQVVPIMEQYCYSCHGNENTGGSGGINLNTYASLGFYAGNGFLVGNITYAHGYVGMPFGKPPVPACEINTIVAWVNQGAKNN
jgi:hypothetical protein